MELSHRWRKRALRWGLILKSCESYSSERPAVGWSDWLGVLRGISVSGNQVASRDGVIYDLPAAGFLPRCKGNYRVVRPFWHCALHVSFIGFLRVDGVNTSANAALSKRQLGDLANVILREATSIRPAHLR
jgi:hypothetical protein